MCIRFSIFVAGRQNQGVTLSVLKHIKSIQRLDGVSTLHTHMHRKVQSNQFMRRNFAHGTNHMFIKIENECKNTNRDHISIN